MTWNMTSDPTPGEPCSDEACASVDTYRVDGGSACAEHWAAEVEAYEALMDDAAAYGASMEQGWREDMRAEHEPWWADDRLMSDRV